MTLTEPLAPLTSRQRTILIVVAAVCALTRFLALARTLWDWDEALFCLGMRLYDVTNHHPHPPGFPVYIGLAHIARIVTHDDFRALQSINLLAAMCVFPAVYFFARELRFPFTTCTIAGALFAFLPNVWFFGGGAFSDVPSIVLVTFAAAMLLRGCRDANAYLTGTLLLALAIGIRPQNFLIGLVPGLIATWYRARRSFRDVLFALMIGVVMVTVSFGGAIVATGSFARYMNSVREHGAYISKIDSFRSPDRPPLWRLFDRFFIKQYDAPALSILTSIFVLVSVVGAIRNRDRRIALDALTFGPFAISAWMMLDRYSVSRFSIGYAPMFAVLAADGIRRASRGREDVEAALGAVLIGAFLVWTWPALTPVRNDVSPPVAAIDAMKRTLDPKRDQLYVTFSMTPFVEYLAPNVPFFRVQEQRAMPLTPTPRRPYLLSEITTMPAAGPSFVRERGRLWNIARRHYFEVELRPLRGMPQFVSGWYAPERTVMDEWRWTSGHAITKLPPVNGPATLRLDYRLATEILPQHPRVTITLNGQVVDQYVATSDTIAKEYEVTSAPNEQPNILELSIDKTLNQKRAGTSDDNRDLGLLVRYLSFGPR